MDTEADFRSQFERYGGLLDRANLSEDSGIGATWQIGETILEQARQRLEGAKKELSIHFNIGVVSKPMLNAVARRGDSSYLAAVFWPLPLTIQGVAAAIWANPVVAPWIGDTSSLRKRTEFDASFPPGFDLYLALENKVDLDPAMFRSGVRIDDIEAIISAGEDRWDAFLVTWNSALRFVWGHEFAHILYGHIDLVDSEFGVSELYESEGISRQECPEALSQFMEFIADMDSAMNVFSLFYGSFFPEEVEVTSTDHLNTGAATTLGILIGIYVLWQGYELKSRRGHRSHPPIEHRATWILGAESRGVDALRKKTIDAPDTTKKIDAFRNATFRLLATVAEAHESLAHWIRRIDDSAEELMNEYVSAIRRSSEPYHDALDRMQKVRD